MIKKTLRRHLEKLRKIKRKAHHPLIHKIHKKHKLSKKTLFYIKEYGPHSNVARTIIRESVKILLFVSIISSLGGLAIESIKTIFVSLLPFVILLPALNGMIGNYGIIFSSRFSTMLHTGKARGGLFNSELKKLFCQIIIISLLTTMLAFIVALIVSGHTDIITGIKILAVTILDVAFLVGILFFVSVFAGWYFYKKKEDPNNFLIPITTSIADFGNMLILSLLVVLLF